MFDMNAKYTVLLKTIMEHPESKEKLDAALSTYPLYKTQSESDRVIELMPTRERLNKKLLNHYKYREIGFETIGRFLDELEISMNEIMPYYNQMLNTVDIMNDIDSIFDNVDVVHTFKETTTDKTEGSAKTNTKSSSENSSTNTTNASDSQTSNSTMSENGKAVKSETPQSELSIPASGIDSVSYADQVNWDERGSTSTGTTSGTTNSTSTLSGNDSASTETTGENETLNTKTIEHELRRKGNQGVNTYAHDIIEFRKTLLNIEQMIINDSRISELFMQVF